jgi:hypothetical protein
MKEQRQVVLYGNSLLLAGAEASLRGRPGLEVARLDVTLPDLSKRLRHLRPDVIVFDLSAPHPEFAFTFLQENPGLLLIGLDANSDTVIMLSSQHHTAARMDDLIQVIQTRMRIDAFASGGSETWR